MFFVKTYWSAVVIALVLPSTVFSKENSSVLKSEDVILVRPLNNISNPLIETIFYSILELALIKM